VKGATAGGAVFVAGAGTAGLGVAGFTRGNFGLPAVAPAPVFGDSPVEQIGVSARSVENLNRVDGVIARFYGGRAGRTSAQEEQG